MRPNRRFAIAIGVVLLLGAFALLGRWYESTPSATAQPVASTVAAFNVSSGADRGAGSLREAVFLAAAAQSRARIALQVSSIALETALPPLINPRGVEVVAQEAGTTIDASALTAGPVFDVNGPNTSITGVSIRNCAGSAILLRAPRFRLTSANIEACDVGVDVAENARDLSIERSAFSRNRIGIRFAASSRNAVVVKNEFSANTDAGVWAVRGAPDARNAAVAVRDNRFANERLGLVAGNVSVLVENNHFVDSREAAMHLIGAGATVRNNRITRGAAMGIVAENARSAVIEGNELDRLTAYGIMVRGSSNALVRANRIHNCGYGLAFVLGEAKSPSTAVENSIAGVKYDAIHVVGDSPILRRNRVQQARVEALRVEHFQRPDGVKVTSNPFLEGNTFESGVGTVAAKEVNAQLAVAPQ